MGIPAHDHSSVKPSLSPCMASKIISVTFVVAAAFLYGAQRWYLQDTLQEDHLEISIVGVSEHKVAGHRWACKYHSSHIKRELLSPQITKKKCKVVISWYYYEAHKCQIVYPRVFDWYAPQAHQKLNSLVLRFQNWTNSGLEHKIYGRATISTPRIPFFKECCLDFHCWWFY
jgi:hypothetical protein